VKDVAGVTLLESQIDTNRDTIKIKKTGPEKTQIFINRNRIEERIQKELNSKQNKKEVEVKKKVI